MTRSLCLFLGGLSLTFSLRSQDCSDAQPENGAVLHANNYRAFFSANGSPLWHIDQALPNHLIYDDSISGPIATIFAQGIWLGGLAADSTLRVTAATYDNAFYPGPLDTLGQPVADDCSDYDRVWSVRRHEIMAHRADYADNQVIDDPIPSVMGWPGRGNANFITFNGFPLSAAMRTTAPFFDLNQDGIYSPELGEYPVEPRHLSIADHLLWSVANTESGPAPELLGGLPFPAQLETTAWALSCSEDTPLNDAFFARYRISNLSQEDFTGVRFGLWTDFDLGCFTDDFMGVDTLTGTAYAYNQDNEDNEPCLFGVAGAGINPPVQSITFLNQSLDAFTYHQSAGVDGPPPMLTPNTAPEYYYYLNARWRDGSPLQLGGDGFDEGGAPRTNYAFPGDPNDENQWSLAATDLSFGDRRVVAVNNINDFPSGSTFEIDVLYAYHRQPGADYLGNISAMFPRVAELQSSYANGWSNDCTILSCEDEVDCIYAGDLNADGIANYVDLVTLNFDWGAEGPQRRRPANWSPVSGLDWPTQQAVGPNQKHLDANGDGVVNEADYGITLNHYNFTRLGYERVVEDTPGSALTFTFGSISDDARELNPGQVRMGRVYVTSPDNDLQAVSFTLEYDSVYFETFEERTEVEITDGNLRYLRHSHAEQFECVAIEKSAQFPSGEPLVTHQFFIKIKEEFPGNFPNEPLRIRFRDVRGWLSDGTEVSLGSIEKTVDIAGVTTSTSEPRWAKDVVIYPNPATHSLLLDIGLAPVQTIQLFDAFGRLISSVEDTSRRIDLSAFAAGTYWVRFSGTEGSIVRKVIKQ
ncbi:MAG: T9SS type A sorting domain-containing protein [Bacteroidota bacterium]